jgi:hypothetical protein
MIETDFVEYLFYYNGFRFRCQIKDDEGIFVMKVSEYYKLGDKEACIKSFEMSATWEMVVGYSIHKVFENKQIQIAHFCDDIIKRINKRDNQ